MAMTMSSPTADCWVNQKIGDIHMNTWAMLSEKHYSCLAHNLVLGSMNNGFLHMQFHIPCDFIPTTDAHTYNSSNHDS